MWHFKKVAICATKSTIEFMAFMPLCLLIVVFDIKLSCKESENE